MNGDIIRKIRENKGYSLPQLSDGIMSASQLSKFERNETNITFNKFISLLNRLDITMEEYVFLADDDALQSTEMFVGKIKNAYLSKDLIKLENFKKEEVSKGKNLNAIMITALTKNIDSNIQLDDTELSEVCDYLFTVNMWGKHEIILFGNIVICLPVNIMKTYINKLIRQRVHFYNTKSNIKLFIGALVNISFTLLKHDLFEEASVILNMIDQESHKNEYLLLERNTNLFIKGLYLYKTNEIESGIKLMNKSINIFQTLDCMHLANGYNELYQQLISK